MDYSVIIPVWETPPEYIEKCIRSVTANRDCEWEILLVNDGSTGETASYLKGIRDARATVISSPHAGVSAARNLGLSRARGERVLFLDADDELRAGALDALLPLLRREDPDLLLAQVARQADSAAPGSGKEGFPLDGEEDRRRLRRYYMTMRDPDFRQEEKWLNRAPHARIIRRELALSVGMPEEISFGEDVIWNFCLLREAKHIFFLPWQIYDYHENAFSATQQYRDNFPEEIRKLLELYRKETADWPEEDKPLLWAAEMEYFNILMRVYVFAAPEKKRRANFRETIQNPDWRQAFREVSLKDVHGRCRLTAVLGKAGAWELMYRVFAGYHSRQRNKVD